MCNRIENTHATFEVVKLVLAAKKGQFITLDGEDLPGSEKASHIFSKLQTV
ncbi:MAG TPA: hypothetical protein VLF94_06680 [Chlamydiales bacterium]|nr:hypothetical protein [Chlamydiales bacterium]